MVTVHSVMDFKQVISSKQVEFREVIFAATLPKTKIAPENGWLEDEFPFGKAYFQELW